MDSEFCFLRDKLQNRSWRKLKTELKKIIEPEKDSIIFFKLREAYLTKKEIIGREKNDTSNII